MGSLCNKWTLKNETERPTDRRREIGKVIHHQELFTRPGLYFCINPLPLSFPSTPPTVVVVLHSVVWSPPQLCAKIQINLSTVSESAFGYFSGLVYKERTLGWYVVSWVSVCVCFWANKWMDNIRSCLLVSGRPVPSIRWCCPRCLREWLFTE